MSKKIKFAKRQSESPPEQKPSLPRTLHLTNLTNKQNSTQVHLLKQRIEQLENKVVELESKIRSKRKRIRRKSNEVQKKFKCQQCKKQYGSMVSLNLHLRIKHTKEKQQANLQPKEQQLLKGSPPSK